MLASGLDESVVRGESRVGAAEETESGEVVHVARQTAGRSAAVEHAAVRSLVKEAGDDVARLASLRSSKRGTRPRRRRGETPVGRGKQLRLMPGTR